MTGFCYSASQRGRVPHSCAGIEGGMGGAGLAKHTCDLAQGIVCIFLERSRYQNLASLESNRTTLELSESFVFFYGEIFDTYWELLGCHKPFGPCHVGNPNTILVVPIIS